MEKVFVHSLGVSEEKTEACEGFWITIVGEDEGEEVLRLLKAMAEDFEPEWLSSLGLANEQAKNKEGSLGIIPRMARLGTNLYYICYRDIDEKGKESAVRCFLTPTEVLLLGWAGIAKEQLAAWARRRILCSPLDLTQVMGTRVLRHHQERLEELEDQMDRVEEEILQGPRAWQQKKIILFHRRAIGLKKSLNAHQSVFIRLANMDKTEGSSGWQELLIDMQRELENVRQAHELVENLREAYQAAVDNRANDIMKLLTLLATVLLPINLLTSFFGMNFDGMPLLHKPYGMAVFFVLSLLIVVGVVFYLRKKKWLK